MDDKEDDEYNAEIEITLRAFPHIKKHVLTCRCTSKVVREKWDGKQQRQKWCYSSVQTDLCANMDSIIYPRVVRFVDSISNSSSLKHSAS